MTIRWGSLVSDERGEIDYVRVRSLTSIVLAVIGGVSAVWVVFISRAIATDLVAIMVGSLVLPLTGGKIADAFSAVAANKMAAQIQTGAVAGRRASDPGVPVP